MTPHAQWDALTKFYKNARSGSDDDLRIWRNHVWEKFPVLAAEYRRMREALEQIEERFRAKGHHDTCSYALSGAEHRCDCGAYIARDALRGAKGEP